MSVGDWKIFHLVDGFTTFIRESGDCCDMVWISSQGQVSVGQQIGMRTRLQTATNTPEITASYLFDQEGNLENNLGSITFTRPEAELILLQFEKALLAAY